MIDRHGPTPRALTNAAYAAGAFHYEVISISLSRHLGEHFQVDVHTSSGLRLL